MIRQQNHMFVDQVKKTIQTNGLLDNVKTVLVGFSGGADSVALTRVLYLLSKEIPFRLIAVHVNHMLRGVDSDKDEAFVRKFCSSYGIPCEVFKKNVASYARNGKYSIEQAGRKVRQACFEDISKKYDNVVVATGHHKDDLVETFFINLFRGASSNGLSGMAYKSSKGWIKPLLDVSREAVENFLKDEGLTFCIDQTNFELDYTRNKIRNEFIPYIKSNLNPSVEKTISQTSKLMRLEKEYWEQRAEALFLRYCHMDENRMCVMINRVVFDALFLLERYHLVRRMMYALLGDVEDIQFKHVEAVVGLSQTGKKANLARALLAYLTADDLIIVFSKSENIKSRISHSFKVQLITLEDYYARKLHFDNKSVIAVDKAKIKGSLTIRNRVAGDRFVPLGMKQSKKLKDFFIDQKVPQGLRDFVPIMCDEEKIVWICGYRQDERTKISSTTENILIISLE